jgi:hypothetical protein
MIALFGDSSCKIVSIFVLYWYSIQYKLKRVYLFTANGEKGNIRVSNLNISAFTSFLMNLIFKEKLRLIKMSTSVPNKDF